MGKKRKAHKCTKGVKIERVTAVMALILRGLRPADIVRYGSEKGWKIDRRQVEKYITAANNEIMKQAEPKRSVEFAKSKLRYEEIFAQATAEKNFSARIAAQKEIDELMRLKPKRIEHSGPDGGPIRTEDITDPVRRMSDEDLERAIEERRRTLSSGNNVQAEGGA